MLIREQRKNKYLSATYSLAKTGTVITPSYMLATQLCLFDDKTD